MGLTPHLLFCLALQALFLLIQIDSDMVKRGASGRWKELEGRLGLGQAVEPTILSVDTAISLMRCAIDWVRIYRRVAAVVGQELDSSR